MGSKSRTRSDTTTTTAADVKCGFDMVTCEITAITDFAKVGQDFDTDSAMVEISILALNAIIESVHLEFYLGSELVREYRYVISHRPGQSYGPDASNPPLEGIDLLPDGTRVRLTARRQRGVPEDRWQDWLRRLGWQEVDPLDQPEDMQVNLYGRFQSGSFGLERHVATNPKYDLPMGKRVDQIIGKRRGE